MARKVARWAEPVEVSAARRPVVTAREDDVGVGRAACLKAGLAEP